MHVNAAHLGPGGPPPSDRRGRRARRGRTRLTITVERREQWRSCLVSHYATAPGVWLTSTKQATGRGHLACDGLVEEALCFVWVDSRSRSLDEARSHILVTPRKPTSRCSRLSKQRVERLSAAGLMMPAGAAAVEVAKRNGA